MIDKKLITDEKTYRIWKGADWPSYDEFINQNYIVDDNIQKEIDEFVAICKKKYNDIATPRTVELSKSNQARQKQIFYNKNYTGTIQCRIPWKTLGVNANGNVYICQSPSWIPIFIGNIFEVDDIYEILNSEIARKIRFNISNNSYYYCNNNICDFFRTVDRNKYQTKLVDERDIKEIPFVDSPDLYVNQIPTEIIFDFDYTCNFQCPSCRTEIQNWNNDFIRRPINDQIVEKVKSLIIDKIEDQHVMIRWCGGEPFMSEVYLELFDYIIKTNKKNIQNIIQTNGSLLKSKKDLMIKLLPYIKQLYISFDAGSEETYKITRVGGDWNRLLENTKFIVDLIAEYKFQTDVKADFVVQKSNFKDLPKFAQLCKELGIKPNHMQKMWNWGTWDDDVFADLNVYDRGHPLYEEVRQQFTLANFTIAKN